MNNFLRKEDRSRFVDVSQRLSSAQPPFGGKQQVAVSFAGAAAGFNFKEASKNARRVTNLQLLKKHVFDDSVAKMAARAEIAPQRLAALFDLELVLSSELAEHLEKSLGLPGGWLDHKRDDWSEQDTQEVLEHMRRAEREQEEAEAEHQPRVFLVRAEEKKPQTTQAEVAAQPLIATAAPAQGENSHANKERNMEAIPADLAWLNSQLDALPRGSRSRLAKLMNRSVNDLSAWLRGHRPMPAFVRPTLIAALKVFDAKLAAEFIEQTRAAGFGEHVQAAESIEIQSLAQDATQQSGNETPTPSSVTGQEAAQPQAIEAAQATAPAVAQPAHHATQGKSAAPMASSVVKSRAGSSTYITFRKPSARAVEINEMAMRTAQTLAEVVSSVMRMQEMAARAEASADSE